jgi:hypothetical protein
MKQSCSIPTPFSGLFWNPRSGLCISVEKNRPTWEHTVMLWTLLYLCASYVPCHATHCLVWTDGKENNQLTRSPIFARRLSVLLFAAGWKLRWATRQVVKNDVEMLTRSLFGGWLMFRSQVCNNSALFLTYTHTRKNNFYFLPPGAQCAKNCWWLVLFSVTCFHAAKILAHNKQPHLFITIEL